ncbi:glycosyltransferase [Candidatus Dojkabacteria bacterium]|jgi:glycosyltransferase involved in cell wall biosynthesis|nr:glycosyltransferase [Candidatus Dojkabacteria bacterium]
MKQLPEGWFSDQDIITYRELVSSIPNNGFLLELGSWKGRSICSIADLIIDKNIHVSIVDTFQGTESEGDAHKEAKDIDLKKVFLENIESFGLSKYITVYQETTDNAVKNFQDGTFNFIFIDADHTKDAVTKDINNYRPKLNQDGILSGHDFAWHGVREALDATSCKPIVFNNIWYVGKLNRSNKFSICFIGKNEAKTLPRALESLREFKNRGGEICYLDTGSTDGTAQIARDAGCIVEEVGDKFISLITKEQANSINDTFIVDGEPLVVSEGDSLFRFGDARNYCAEYLATNDMIATMDCDEVYTKLDINKIEELIAQGYDQFEYNFVFAHDEHGKEAVKFIQSKFYNRKKIRWVGIIHEVLQGSGNRMFLGEEIIKLEHWQNHETNRGGYLRGLALDCWQHPSSDRNSHYFARELYWTGRYKSAIKEFERHLTIGNWKAERCQSMIYIGECYMRLNDVEKGIEWMHRAYQEDGNRREPLIRLAETYYYRKEWLKVASYCMAALEIPFSGFYASNTSYYENVPHELLAEAKWFLNDKKASKEHFDKALAFKPLRGKLLYDYRFHYPLPKISILVPTLGRPDGLKRCMDSIDKLNYPKELIEVLVVEDDPRIGVPRRVKELYDKSTGDYIIFAANDMEFHPDSVILAFIDMIHENKGLCAFKSSEYILEDEGNICEHFMITRNLINELGGYIFDVDFDHCGVDNLLWYRCKKIGQAMRSERAVIIHHHFTRENVPMDDVYALVNANRDSDRKLLKRKIAEIELNDMISKLERKENFSFTKVGDGEMSCIQKGTGVNCDGQEYSQRLGSALVDAYRDLAVRDNIMLAIQSEKRWRLPDVEKKVFDGLNPLFNYWTYDLFLNRNEEITDSHRAFWTKLKNSKRKKVFIGNEKLKGVVNMLNIDEFVIVPEKNAFNEVDNIVDKLNTILFDDFVVLLSAGPLSKVLIYKILNMNQNITCIDTGSAFDPIFVGETRTNQASMQLLKEFYKDLLE